MLTDGFNLETFGVDAMAKILVHRKMKQLCDKVDKEIKSGRILYSQKLLTFAHFFARKATTAQITSFSTQAKSLFIDIERNEKNGMYLFNRLFAKCCIVLLSNHNRGIMRNITKEVKKILFKK